ncbi:MAG: NPCBM/NEW2 domain-containing protein [Phycisphaerae bacterium]
MPPPSAQRATILRRLTPAALTAVALIVWPPVPATGADVEAILIDGRTVSGEWAGAPGGTSVVFRRKDGPITLALHEISLLTFHAINANPVSLPGPPRAKTEENAAASDQPPSQPPDRPTGDTGNALSDAADSPPSPAKSAPAVFHLADGGKLFGRLLPADGVSDAVRTATVLGDATLLPFQGLAGIQLAGGDYVRADEVFQDALAARLPGHDLLITRSLDEVRLLRGQLVRIGPAGGAFSFGGRTRDFRAERVFGIVLAATGGRAARHRWPVTAALVDGSLFSGRLTGGDSESLGLKTSVGTELNLRLDLLAELRLQSDRVVYLSDLKPSATHVAGLLHRPWPVAMDKNVAGGPLAIGGRVFAKGIGVHSRTEISYALNGAYERFVSTIGIDDAVRPRGNVVFQVLADARIRFDSGELSGSDPPRPVLVDVSGVKTLTLVVDYGAAMDVADQADWADARLLKPASRVQE